MKRLMTILATFIILCMISDSLVAQRYIPKELKKFPKDSLAILKIAQEGIRNVIIDNQKVKKKVFFRVKKKVVYLKPGMHKVTYSALVETEEWQSYIKSMEEKGYKLQSDGTFVKGATIATPLGWWKRYDWRSKTRDIIMEKGGVYILSK
jgi:hypothetical protein